MVHNLQLREYIKNQVLEVLNEEGNLEAELESGLKDIAKDIAQGIEKKEDQLKEEPIVLALSVAFAIPAVIDGLGSLIKLIGKVTKSKGVEDASEKVLHAAHKVHSWFLKPIKWVLKKKMPGTAEDKINELAETIHKSIVFILFVASGIGLAAAIKKAQIGHAAAEAALTAIKGTELGTFVASKL